MVKTEDKKISGRIPAMWQRIFQDSEGFAEFYFHEICGRNEVLVCEDEDGTLKGMLHMNPYSLLIRGEEIPARYIVGVATDREFRRQGVMRELLTNAMLRLRRRGEVFTYLMPADPAYYLPFGFRYGADWLTVELAYGDFSSSHPKSRHSAVPEKVSREETHGDDAAMENAPGFKTYGSDAVTGRGPVEELHGADAVMENAPGEKPRGAYLSSGWTVGEALGDRREADAAASVENEEAGRRYCIATGIDARYYRILEMEARSEQEQVFYVRRHGRYAGRFTVGMREGRVHLSRIACCGEDRTDFLAAALDFCEKTYHCGQYTLTLDESWNKDIPAPGESRDKDIREMDRRRLGFRIEKKAAEPMIMFRILDLEKAGAFLRTEADFEMGLLVTDGQLPEQEGLYRVSGSRGKCHFEKIKGNRPLPRACGEGTGTFETASAEDSGSRSLPQACGEGPGAFEAAYVKGLGNISCSRACGEGPGKFEAASVEGSGSRSFPQACGEVREMCCGGRISIGELTGLLFERRPADVPDTEQGKGLTAQGRRWLGAISPLRENCIMEYV